MSSVCERERKTEGTSDWRRGRDKGEGQLQLLYDPCPHFHLLWFFVSFSINQHQQKKCWSQSTIIMSCFLSVLHMVQYRQNLKWINSPWVHRILKSDLFLTKRYYNIHCGDRKWTGGSICTEGRAAGRRKLMVSLRHEITVQVFPFAA